MNGLTRRKRIAIWVVVGIAVGCIAYGTWLSLNISVG